MLLSDIMIALIAVLFAGLVAAYLHGDIPWKGFGALTAFVAIFLAGISVSRGYWLAPLK